MDAVTSYIDIFAKLIIAFIGLIAPLTSYLLTNYSDRIEQIKRMNEELKNVINNERLNESTESNNEENQSNIDALSQKSTKKLLEIENQEAKYLKYIEPKDNIVILFLCLFFSLLFLIFDVFLRKDYFHDIYAYSHCRSVALLLISLCLFIYTVRRIYKIICAFIDTKKHIDDYERGVKIEQGREIPPGRWS